MRFSRLPTCTSLLTILACVACSKQADTGAQPDPDIAVPPVADTVYGGGTAEPPPPDTSGTTGAPPPPDTTAGQGAPPPTTTPNPSVPTDTVGIVWPPPPPAESLPQFPWPPPQFSSRYVVPYRVLPVGPVTTLGDLYDRLVAALDRGQFFEHSVYARGSDGFALVARLESIEDDGNPKSGEARWIAGSLPRKNFSLSDYINRLLKAQPGRYRVIVFVVTGEPVIAGPQKPTRQQMDSILRGGAGLLPAHMRALPASKAKCEALIYEFFRPSAASQVRLVAQSSIAPVRHLAGAGLWTAKELAP